MPSNPKSSVRQRVPHCCQLFSTCDVHLNLVMCDLAAHTPDNTYIHNGSHPSDCSTHIIAKETMTCGLVRMLICIVTISGFSIHDGIYCTPKVNTLQLNTVSLGTHVHVRPARSRNTHSYRILPTGPLVAIFQHSLPFLQSESFQTHQDNPSSGYRSTCTQQRHLGV
jgi:hypothetical protein